jgi:aspartate carbamoyltransferase catalytic subunit
MILPRLLLDLDSLEPTQIDELIELATSISRKEVNVSNAMAGRVLCPLFQQESSRTYMNSTAGFLRMKGTLLPLQISNTRFGSRWSEPIQDFCVLLNSCADIVIARSPETDTVRRLAEHVSIPIINAGNGSGEGSEHPVQALVDLYTIREEFGSRPLQILMMGGRHIRSTRSQIKLFLRFQHNLFIMSPPSPVANSDIDSLIRTHCEEIESLDDIDLQKVDVIYHNGIDENPLASATEAFVLNRAALERRSFTGKVMHSLPRKAELSQCIDNSNYNLYFRQMINSISAFKAVFCSIFRSKSGE